MSVSMSIILDTRRVKQKTNTYPIQLLVVSSREPKRYTTKYHLSQEDYKKLTAPRLNENLSEIRDNLKEIKRNAELVKDQIKPFTLDYFEKIFILKNPQFKKRKQKSNEDIAEKQDFDFSLYKNKFKILQEIHHSEDCMSNVFTWYIKNLIMEERVGSALNYQNTYYSLKKFKGNVKFEEITPSYLRQYENWMREKGRSKSTVGINLRPLRAIYNLAIDEFNLISRENYPFGRRKYLIPTSKNIKKALSQEEISKIYYHKIDNEEYRQARDFWLFGYFANGMNPKDVALLKYANINGDFLVFERAKTQLTMRNDPKPITVYINEDIQTIIDKWGNNDRSPHNYIFPILDSKMNPLELHYAIRSFIKFINDRMKVICTEIGIKKVTTIYGRHTFSTIMKRSGASTEFIQEALGHADKSTTENYLDSFENELKKELAKKLTNFKKQ